MKAGKLAIRPWLCCPYNEHTLVDLPSSVLVTLKLRNPYVSHSLKIATVDIWIRYIEVYSYIHCTACLVERKSQY